MQEMWVHSLGREDPLEKEMATLSSILAWKFHGQRVLVGHSPWCHKESDITTYIYLCLCIYSMCVCVCIHIYSKSLIIL